MRNLQRRIIAEVVTHYDLDGVTLDFWWHPVFFRKTANEEPCGDEERALMTTLMRDIRADLDAAMRRHGRALTLAVKVPDSVGYCRDIGLDAEKWLADGLVDFLVPGGYFQLTQWSESVALARKHGAAVMGKFAVLPTAPTPSPP